MNKIEKISDLEVGRDYFVCLVKDARFARKCKLIAIINENQEFPNNFKTELYLEFRKSSNLVYCQDIGIGNTKIEAKSNYSKFKYEANKSFSNSYNRVKEERLSTF